jgi:hypothetical protein
MITNCSFLFAHARSFAVGGNASLNALFEKKEEIVPVRSAAVFLLALADYANEQTLLVDASAFATDE